MNTTKLSLVLTVLAVASGLLLGLMSAPAVAHDCARHNEPSHKHCGSDPPTVSNPNPAIVYQIVESDIKGSIAVVDADGSNEIIFASSAGVAYRTPTWSRDGNSILLAATCPQGYRIYRVSIDRGALDIPRLFRGDVPL